MSSRSLVELCIMALLCAGAAQAQAPVTVSVSMVGTIAQGQSATLTWTVTGSTEPVRLRLRNTSPAVGTLHGGDVQVAVTSGGTPNTVSRTVTGLAPGTFDVTVDIDDGRPASRAFIAAAFRQALLSVAALLEREAAALPVHHRGFLRRRVIRRGDVLALLDRTESELRARLPYPELAAFRDGVAQVLDMDRAEVTGMTSSEAPPMREQEARSLLSRVAAWFRSTADMSPIGDVCVRTDPTAAEVVLYPKSFPSDRHSGRSAAVLTLYLGQYEYRIGSATGSFNFLTSPRRVVDCDLCGASGCNLVDGTPGACR